MRWATFQMPPAPTERIGVVRGDEIYAMAAGPRLIDLLGDAGERLAAARAQTPARPPRGARGGRVRPVPPVARPPAGRAFLTFPPPTQGVRGAPGAGLPSRVFDVPV